MRFSITLVALTALAAMGCDKDVEAPPPTPQLVPSVITPAPAATPTAPGVDPSEGLPAGHPPMSNLPPGHPSTTPGQVARGAAAPAPMAAKGGITGELLEHIPAAGYSYLQLETAGGEVWAAVPQTKVDKGATVTVVGAMPMRNFKSRSLDRTFEVIYFGHLDGAGAPPGMGLPKAAPATNPDADAAKAVAAVPGHNPAAAAASADVAPVAKPEGAHTVAEVYAARIALAGKPVTIRGTVTKFNEAIMGKNWIHLQDGSGSADAGSHDITVTTAGVAAVGDVVTVTGTLRVDRDFGAGYSYPVIVEDATLTE